MYLILEIKPWLDIAQINLDAVKINNHISSGISFALTQFNCSINEFIKEEFGNSALNNLDVAEVASIKDVTEPENLGIYLYKTKDDSMTTYVYRKYEKSTPGYIWGKSNVTVFECIRIFILKEYSGLKMEKKIEEVDFVKMNKINMPKQMTISPFADVIKSLKESDRFLKRRNDKQKDD